MEWYEWVLAASIGGMVIASMSGLYDLYVFVVKRQDPRTGEPRRRKS